MKETKYYVLSQDGTEKGEIIGLNEEGCECESCNGANYIVKWADGESTECCSAGMVDIDDYTQQII